MKETIYLGTYTKRDSEGVYQITLDTEKKQLENLTVVAKADSPTYLGLSPDYKTLYPVVKIDGKGGMASYRKNENGEFVFVNGVTAEGAPPCYVGEMQLETSYIRLTTTKAKLLSCKQLLMAL